jgi:hypothetical protein
MTILSNGANHSSRKGFLFFIHIVASSTNFLESVTNDIISKIQKVRIPPEILFLIIENPIILKFFFSR